MHEEALLRDLVRRIEAVAQEERLERVTRIRLWVGALAHVEAEQVRVRLGELTRGGPAEGAEVTVERSEDMADPRAQSILLRGIDGVDASPRGAPS